MTHFLDGAEYADPDDHPPGVPGYRTLSVTRADQIRVRPVRWLWAGRIACGSLALLGGREGIGKSSIAYTLAADITRGRLPGAHHGRARSVIVAATEDSWEHTIVPRLMAAGADLHLILRVDVTTAAGVDTALSLPRDLPALEDLVNEEGVALIILDPLMSRLDTKLDSHKDGDVRQALEPLVALANRTNAALLGLIHVNKSQSNDPLTTLMASRAFAAVARAVLFVMVDPDDEQTRLLGQPKNNLGTTDLPTLTFRIDSCVVDETDEGPVTTGRVHWLGETARSIRDVLESSSDTADTRTSVAEAAAWLVDYLTSVGGTAASSAVRDEGQAAGHTDSTLKRARVRAKVKSESGGFPCRSFWSLPAPVGSPAAPTVGSVSRISLGESDLTGLTEPTGPTATAVGSVGSVSSVSPGPRARVRDVTRCPECSREAGHRSNCSHREAS